MKCAFCEFDTSDTEELRLHTQGHDRAMAVLEPQEPEMDFMQPSLISAAKKYLEATSLPPEALTSVLSMVSSHYGLMNLIKYQQKLPSDRRKSMVGTSPGYVVTDGRLQEIDAFVRMNNLPYNVLYISRDGSIAIKAAGWRMRAQADPRVFKGWDDTPVELVNLADGNIMFRKRVTAIFWTGETFSAEGACDLHEMQSRRQKTESPPSFALMVAETRSKTRALRDAIGLPFEVAEDIVAGELAAIPAASELLPAIKPSKMGISEFLAACKERGMKVTDIVARLQIKNLGEILDYQTALQKLQEGG